MNQKPRSKTTVPAIRAMKRQGQPIVTLTAYDATFARLLDACGVDILLVGDSLGMVVQGGDNTLSVTLEDVIYHTRAVARGTRWAHVVADMPFMSYQASLEEGVRNAGRLIKEGGAESVKIEGGRRHADLIARLTAIGIPVMGHIGLTPQSVHALGGYRVQGKGTEQARRLLEDALALQEAGVYSLVLESVPREVAQQITASVSVPTIGIGAGPECDGQVLVIYDLLGMDESFSPRFVKRYENLSVRIREAVDRFGEEVRAGIFPGPEHSFTSKRAEKEGERSTPASGGEGGETIALYSSGTKR